MPAPELRRWPLLRVLLLRLLLLRVLLLRVLPLAQRRWLPAPCSSPSCRVPRRA